MKKRVLSLLLVFIMILGMMPTAFAAGGDVAAIGDDGYTTLAAAIAAVQDGETITLADGTHTLPAINNKNITITGTENAVINMSEAVNASGSTLTFNGVSFTFPREQYKGFQHATKVVFNDCALSGRQTLYAPTVAFNNCELTHKSTTSVWTYGASDVKFTGCTFNTGGRAVQIYNESTGFTADVSFTDCTFNSDGTDSNKAEALVELNRVATSNNEYELTFTNCEFDVTKDEGRKIWGNSSGNMADESYTVTVDNVQVYPVYSAYIGETGYGSLDEAIAAAEDGDTITLADGEHVMNEISKAKELTITGSANAVIKLANEGYEGGIGTAESTLTFDGVTVAFNNNNYRGFKHTAKLTYKNCTLTGLQFLYAPTVEFTNCVLTNLSTYSVWTYGATDVTFTDCEFYSGGRCIYVYNEKTGDFTANIAFEDCIFNDDNSQKEDNGIDDLKKGAVETGIVGGSSNVYNLSFSNCSTNEGGFQKNNSTSPLWGNKNNMDFNHVEVIIDGEKVTVPNYLENKEIDNAAEEAKAAIDELPYLPKDRKTELKAAVDAAAAEAKANIDKEAAVNAGLEAIKAILDRAKAENKAIIAWNHAVIAGGATYGFADIDGHWAEDGILFCYREGLMNGVGNDKFAPEASTTRGMIMTILARMSGENTDYSYPWYQAGMEWAVANGVSDGTNPEGVITREQLAAMLWRYVGSPEAAGSLAAFGDAANVSDYAVDAMTWAVEEGLINGMNDDLAPQGTATRAQVATIFMRLCRNVLFF